MNIWTKSILIGLLPALIVYFFYDKIKKQKKQELYNAHYTIRATGTDPHEGYSLRMVADLLKKRMETAGWKHEIKNTGPNTISIDLFEIEDTLSPLTYFGANNRVEFREMYTMEDERNRVMLQAVIELMKEQKKDPNKKIQPAQDTTNLSKDAKGLLDSMEKTKEEDQIKEELIRFTSPYQDQQTQRVIYPAEIGTVKVKDTLTVRRLFLNDKIRNLAPPYMRICFGEHDKTVAAKKRDPFVRLYILNTWPDSNKAMLENEDLLEASADFNIEGNPEIRLLFNKDGAKKWSVMTEKNVGRPIAIIINNSVISAPNVLSPIEGGSASITGSFTIEECKSLSLALMAPLMPAKLEILSSNIKKLDPKGVDRKKLWISLTTFLVAAGLGFIVFKTLKST